jgi:hypothetical protein
VDERRRLLQQPLSAASRLAKRRRLNTKNLEGTPSPQRFDWSEAQIGRQIQTGSSGGFKWLFSSIHTLPNLFFFPQHLCQTNCHLSLQHKNMHMVDALQNISMMSFIPLCFGFQIAFFKLGCPKLSKTLNLHHSRLSF